VYKHNNKWWELSRKKHHRKQKKHIQKTDKKIMYSNLPLRCKYVFTTLQQNVQHVVLIQSIDMISTLNHKEVVVYLYHHHHHHHVSSSLGWACSGPGWMMGMEIHRQARYIIVYTVNVLHTNPVFSLILFSWVVAILTSRKTRVSFSWVVCYFDIENKSFSSHFVWVPFWQVGNKSFVSFVLMGGVLLWHRKQEF